MKGFYTHKKYESESDLDLLAKYKADNDLEWIGALYGRYLHLSYGLALNYFNDSDKAKDLVMEVFEVVADKCKNHEVQHFKSWLYVLIKNYCLMQLRKEKRDDEKFQTFFMDKQTELHLIDEYNKESQIAKLEQCLDLLNTEQQTALRLFYFDKLDYKTISHQTGYDLLKVKSYIQNAKRNLKICIEQKEQKEEAI
jgi:RNA polymerase sigma factor (sigma-70 family)